MDWRLILEFLVIVGSLAMGARMGGVGLGLWGAVGLLVLVVGFDVAPANIPGEVLLIVLTVIMAASAMEVAGGIDFLRSEAPRARVACYNRPLGGGCSSVGRVQDCDSCCRGFEPHQPPHRQHADQAPRVPDFVSGAPPALVRGHGGLA